MGGSYKINVIGAFILKLKENIGEPCNRNFFAESSAGYFIVLAEYTFKRATGKEYRTGAVLTADARLFPHMKGGTGNHKTTALTAHTKRTVQTIRIAFARTKPAVLIFFCHM